MSRLIMRIATLPLVMLALAGPLAAQHSGFELRLGGGVGAPIGDFNQSFNVGWHALGAMTYSLPRVPLGLQVDASYAEYGDALALVDMKQSMFHATGDLLYQFRLANTALEPYVIGGGGVYYLDPKGRDAAGLASRTKFGVNAGLGLTFKAKETGIFFESRFHDVVDGQGTKDLQFNNFTVGFRVAM
jgi:outer membrane protein with beta-barrel domain